MHTQNRVRLYQRIDLTQERGCIKEEAVLALGLVISGREGRILYCLVRKLRQDQWLVVSSLLLAYSWFLLRGGVGTQPLQLLQSQHTSRFIK